ncbi:hypothetical protein [Pontibacter indicus]|uniref:hypothetical protein n=1 Tax=Pontibacter indicus TaxID=1317125 RepID=UPI000978B26E|nr:hypothetical protein [Pontibacter indicus]
MQLVLTLFWLSWATMLLVSESPTGDQNYLYYIFFGLAVVFLGYVVLQNTSVFGIQSYIEVTPEYIVQKNGVFRTKMITAIPDIESVHVSLMALRITQRDGNKVYLDLKQIRKRRDIEKVKSRIRELAAVHNFEVTEANPA